MKLTIDNLLGAGAVDYTAAMDGTVAPRVVRKINQAAQMRCSLVTSAPGFIVPLAGARVIVAKTDGSLLFTGYLTQAPQLEYLGWGEAGSVYRSELVAESDEILLDQKALPNRAPFVARSAGGALRQLAQDLLPGGFDTSAVQDVDTLAIYEVNPEKKFSFHAAEIALASRSSYRAMNSALMLGPVGAATYTLNESDMSFSPAGLKLASPPTLVNDVTIIGMDEPEVYVRDYFVGDGETLRFYLSQTPFQQGNPALIDEEFVGPGLDATTWVVNDPASATSVAAQTLVVNGGTGQDGQTVVQFIEQVELGGALELQHGDVSFAAPSTGVIGGLYPGAISAPGCLAGFQISPSGSESVIQAVISGSPTGPVMATTAGHRYILTTFLYSMEVNRAQETFHSSVHPAGSGWGGAAIAANVRFVLGVQEIDPANPATLVAPATVLYDGVIQNAPGFCTYALVNATNMQSSMAYTYAAHISLAEVRTALPGSVYETQVVGSLSDGAACEIASSTSLDFYPLYVAPLNTLIVASYRGSGRAVAEVVNSASVASLVAGPDNGVRGIVRTVKTPSARAQTDCENAALAILDDASGAAWSGSYVTWSDFLPGMADDVFPGDGLQLNVPSRRAVFGAIVRAVSIEIADAVDDRGIYTIEFANDLAASLALRDAASAAAVPLADLPVRLSTAQVGNYYLPDLTDAQLSAVTASDLSGTTVTVDVGMAPMSGGGIEVRAHDYGWGVANDRNLLGRFNTRTFSLPRLARTQTYFMRMYDGSSPPRYSRYAAAIHVDYPLT